MRLKSTTKGTSSFGKGGSSKTHIVCRRCGRHSYNIHKRRCAACGYGISAGMRQYSWQNRKVNKKRII